MSTAPAPERDGDLEWLARFAAYAPTEFCNERTY